MVQVEFLNWMQLFWSSETIKVLVSGEKVQLMPIKCIQTYLEIKAVVTFLIFIVIFHHFHFILHAPDEINRCLLLNAIINFLHLFTIPWKVFHCFRSKTVENSIELLFSTFSNINVSICNYRAMPMSTRQELDTKTSICRQSAMMQSSKPTISNTDWCCPASICPVRIVLIVARLGWCTIVESYTSTVTQNKNFWFGYKWFCKLEN